MDGIELGVALIGLAALVVAGAVVENRPFLALFLAYCAGLMTGAQV